MTVTVNTVNVNTDAGWSIDELASLTGVPSRTIREYRTVGILMPPRRVGRTGRYDESHRRRLEVIARLQTRGYSLAGMRDLFDAWDRGSSLEDVLGDSGLDEAVLEVSDDELIGRFAAAASSLVRERAIDIGLIHPGDPGRWLVRSPSLLALVGDAVAAGVSVEAALGTAATMRTLAESQARAIVDAMVGELAGRLGRDDAERLARRVRVHAARAASSLIVDALGRAVAAHPELPDAVRLLDAVRVGPAR